MNWTMKTPCADCPFRKVGGIRLALGRVRDIGGMMLSSSGGTFPCHKSVHRDKDDEGGWSDVEGDDEVHCAGALIFAEKNGNATQMMRIMERFGDYDASRFDDADKALVFDTLAEMKATAIR